MKTIITCFDRFKGVLSEANYFTQVTNAVFGQQEAAGLHTAVLCDGAAERGRPDDGMNDRIIGREAEAVVEQFSWKISLVQNSHEKGESIGFL